MKLEESGEMRMKQMEGRAEDEGQGRAEERERESKRKKRVGKRVGGRNEEQSQKAENDKGRANRN